MYSWGKLTSGQLGLGSGLEESYVSSPKAVTTSFDSGQNDEKEEVAFIDAGDEHTVVLTNRGRVFTCGSNDFGQLGQEEKQSRFGHVSSLAPYTIRTVACGEQHTIVLDEWGKVFSWGGNKSGQCGHNPEIEVQPQPKIIRGLGTEIVAQIASGDHHSVALTKGGQVFSWGDNTFGQLGLGKLPNDNINTPQAIQCLQALPIRQIACGGNHTMIVSMSGAVYAWGKNSRGQLGLGDTQDRNVPTLVKSLRNQHIVFISCGQEFSVCLTREGGVFSFGAGSYGQLGHGTKNDEQLPRKIIELMGTEVTQIACGKRHTLALVPSRGRLYAFGLGGSGQLGTSTNANALSPQIVHGPWTSPSGEPAAPKRYLSKSQEQSNIVISVIGAGGDCSFASVTDRNSLVNPIDQRKLATSTQIEQLTAAMVDEMCGYSSTDKIDQDFLERLEIVFGSPACLNASFLTPNDAHHFCTSNNSGIDIEAWNTTCDKVNGCQNESIRDLVLNQMTKVLVPKLKVPPPDTETLRIFITLPMFRFFENPKLFSELHSPFSRNLISLTKPAWAVVENWISVQKAEYLRPYVNNYKATVVHILRTKDECVSESVYTASLDLVLIVLRILNRINVMNKCIVGYEDFYISELNELIDIRAAYCAWLMSKRQTGFNIITDSKEFFICNFPFIFDSQAKTLLLQLDQAIQMQNAVLQATSQAAFQALFVPNAAQTPTFQYLYLEIDRTNIVEDTLILIRQLEAHELRKPLKVKFRGEEAEDAGGVTKEFFLLLLRDILDPKYGMFKVYEETQTIWFQSLCFEETLNFFLIGVLCGLAIYNFTIINVPFPLVLYKKLLGEVGSTGFGPDDLEGLSPLVAKGLRDLLAYEAADLDDVFSLNFTLTEENYGENREVELKENGRNISVTQENKSEYVQLYCDYVLNKSVKSQFDGFYQGFHKVCGGRVLDLFHSRELMALVAGTENYNWNELEESVQYKEGYDKDHPTIVNFWSVFHSLNDEDKKKFLKFLTGADRVPILGLKSLNIIIQKVNDENFLPVAHTCFNILDLPCYATREKLKYKLLQAIQCTEGFGLV